MQATSAATPAPPPVANGPRLGEELPIFCERCGYSLVGLPQRRCAECDILQFHCPECGHHQPINTLRPAAQRILGRMRAFVLGCWVFFKLNFFGWTLFGWFVAGHENSYGYNYAQNGLDGWLIAAVTIWGALWGAIGRMLLLRWGNSLLVGLVLGALLVIAMALGARAMYASPWAGRSELLPILAIVQLLAVAGFAAGGGAAAAWALWVMAVWLLLPRRVGGALLEWQRAQSQPRTPAGGSSDLARD